MVKCSNCKAEVEESKIFLHERFCFQNIKYCEKCNEGIVKEEFDEHLLMHKSKQLEENKNVSSEVERNSRTLERVESSKVGCQYCGFLLGYAELEEHEEMCGARTTECKICGKTFTYKNLDNHIKSVHNMDKDIYKECESGSIKNGFDDYKIQKPNLKENFNEDELRRMTSSEQIAYALALSEQQNNNSNSPNDINLNKKMSSSSQNIQKKGTSTNLDELEDEYERQMYEEEMRNYQ